MIACKSESDRFLHGAGHSWFLGWIGLVILAKFWGGFVPEAMGIVGFAVAFLELPL